MGGLGNGRRGGRSPLLIGALIACILMLGFNYWISNSRNVELQTKLYELEGQVQRAAGETGAVEQKKKEFQEQVLRQSEQISRIESLHKRQLESAQNSWKQERETLLLNISTSGNSIQSLKSQLSVVLEERSQARRELQTCQSNLNTLNKKLMYDMTQCNTQILAQKEECAEKLAAAKQGAEKIEKRPSEASQKVHVSLNEGVENKAVQDQEPGNAAEPQQPQLEPQKATLPKGEVEANATTVVKAAQVPVTSIKATSNAEDLPSPVQGPEGPTRARKRNHTEGDMELEVLDTHGGQMTAEAGGPSPALLIGREKEEEQYEADEQVVDESEAAQFIEDTNKGGERVEMDLEDALADYNGDDENEGEFEADKQAELAET